MNLKDTIVALATPPGMGAIAVIRVSGKEALRIVQGVFKPIRKGKLEELDSHTVHLGHIVLNDGVLDKVLLTLFRNPNSYTGEDVVEISCHGSLYIQQAIIQLLLDKGCRMAAAGEFTLRAFLNGKMDLSQAEAVADLIASEDRASHSVAMKQMRGGFSEEISALREQLVHFASMIELELDFSGEDVEFANREELETLLKQIEDVLKRLVDSFTLGNVLKHGVPVAIVGAPNAGKSTLLNAFLNEERAIVSDIPGTTRDTIEDEITVNGVRLRFIDTAGLRLTDDAIETIGIKKAFEKIELAEVVIYLVDGAESKMENDARQQLEDIKKSHPDTFYLIAVNKSDLLDKKARASLVSEYPDSYFISAKEGRGIAELLTTIAVKFSLEGFAGSTIVSNSRHYNSLTEALKEINNARSGLDQGLSGDLLAIDIRQALYHLGEITGEVTTDDLLGNIFSSFCIGK